MGSPERVRSSMKRDSEDVKSRVRDDDEAKCRSRKIEDDEEYEGLDGSDRKRNTGNRNENRKRSSGSTRADSNEYEYDVKRESRSKQGRKELEGSALEKLSNWYQDGEVKNVHGGDRGSSLSVDGERRRTSSKFLDYDGSQTRSRGKDEKFHHGDPEKALEKDYRYSERRGSEKDKTCETTDAQDSKRKWDELDASRDADESNHVNLNDKGSEKSSGSKLGAPRDKADSIRIEASNSGGRDLDLDGEKDSIYKVREERRNGSEWNNTGNYEAMEEHYRGGSTHDDRSSKGKIERPKQIKTSSGWDVVGSQDLSFNTDEGSSKSMKEKSRIGTESSNISRAPESSDKHHCDPESFEMDYDGANALTRKEEKEPCKDYELKGRDESQSVKNRDSMASKDTWRRRQSIGEKERNDGRDWELPRCGRDSDKSQGRLFGGRKDGNRTEAVKTSSKYGISNENYDVIEIQTKPLDDGREKSISVASLEAVEQPVTVVSNNNEDANAREDLAGNVSGSMNSGDDFKSRLVNDNYVQDPKFWKVDTESHEGTIKDQKGALSSRGWSGQGLRSGSLPPQGNYESSSLNRGIPQGIKGNSTVKGGRGRLTGRDSQPPGLHMPMIGSAFGHLGMPPLGAMQSHFSNMSPAPVPPISPGMFIPPFSPPFIWPGPRGVEMNILSGPPGPSGLAGPWFPPSQVNPANPTMYFNQPNPGQGAPLSTSGSNYMTHGRGQPPDVNPGGWTPSRTGVPPGKAPSRGEQNDYSQNFVDTGMRPQNFIRELELTSVVEDYPKLRELIQRKDEIVSKVATPPMYLKCDLLEKVLSPELFGTKFDVILIDPPWEEYVHRAPGVTDHLEYWNFEDIMKLKIEEIADTPSFLFLWVGDGFGLEQGRQCLKKWGFRRCEDISWVKTNKTNATPGLRHDSHTLFQRSKEHCLMGIRGTVRRGPDGHIIHANIDTDVIIAEEPPYGSTAKPEDMYRIIEHFALGRRRLELFGEDHNIRSGWLTVGKGLSSSNFSAEAYCRSFADVDGKVWQGTAGRNPPPEAPHLVQTTPEIEALRPKSPMKNQQQTQQQSASISLTTTNTLNKRTENSPQNYNTPNLNQEGFGSNISRPGPWASPVESFKRDGGHIASAFR